MNTEIRRTLSAPVKAVLAAALALPLIAACAPTPVSPDPASVSPQPAPSVTLTEAAAPSGDLLADHGLEGLDVVAIIDKLDALALADRPTDLIASIRPTHLLLKDESGREQSLPMPDDAFYVSFAPYLTQTHDCHFHSLTTCVGELQHANLAVTITDDATGEVVVDEALTTFDNGFAGVWLPRGIDATLTVEYEGKTATAPITTDGDDSATCITTLQLA
ncbi:MAG: CueP family metal-binding protein [Tessaracoccus sp.]|uniref:CueP family metal-binding protein n=1 Tax=Tessaracoccus sp. TaxID=1971211 RepID=UPI001ED2E5CA|nr:CueP family metal-binding protein [Tessaracoccus sp.]MBK7821015.1 CueP family metal-binding protein [Tessaracoccus sp.]